MLESIPMPYERHPKKGNTNNRTNMVPLPKSASRPVARTWSLAELMGTEFPDPVWAVPDLLPVGLTILAGKPKAGKSWLALQLALSVSIGGMFFSRKVSRRPVVYYGLEDSPRRLQGRLQKMGAQIGDLSFLFETYPLGSPEGVDLFWRSVDDAKAQLVILDTMTRAFSGSVKDWNDVVQVTAALEGIQKEAQARNVCILCVDHHRKGAGTDPDAVIDVLGSTGKVAVADCLWGLYRQRGKSDTTLQVTGRDVENNELALEFDHDTGCWQLLGDTETVRRDSAQLEVINALIELGGEATTTEVAGVLNKNVGNVSKALAELVASGHVKKGQRRGREVPYLLP